MSRVRVYLYKKGYDEDSVLLFQSILQSVEQSAVPVNQVKLQTDRGTEGQTEGQTAWIKEPVAVCRRKQQS